MTASVDEGKGVDTVRLDFSKAFDKVSLTFSHVHDMYRIGKIGKWAEKWAESQPNC